MAETDCVNGHDMQIEDEDEHGVMWKCRNCTYRDYISKKRS